MTAQSPSPASPPADLDEARLRRLLAQRRADAAKLAETDEKLADFRRRWSARHGYGVVLTLEQMLRAIEAGRG